MLGVAHLNTSRTKKERRAGELLREMEKAKGTLKQGNVLPQSHDVTTGTPTLSTLGISKDQSSRWQQIAEIPEDSPEVQVGCGLAGCGSFRGA